MLNLLPIEGKTFEELVVMLEQMQAEKTLLDRKEKALREALVAAAFPNPREGVNKVLMKDGREFKATVKVNRSVNQEIAKELLVQLPKITNEYSFDHLFTTKYELKVGPFKKLQDKTRPDDPVREAIELAITSRPGMPDVEVK